MTWPVLYIAYFLAINGINYYIPQSSTYRLKRSRFLQLYGICHNFLILLGLPVLLHDLFANNPRVRSQVQSSLIRLTNMIFGVFKGCSYSLVSTAPRDFKLRYVECLKSYREWRKLTGGYFLIYLLNIVYIHYFWSQTKNFYSVFQTCVPIFGILRNICKKLFQGIKLEATCCSGTTLPSALPKTSSHTVPFGTPDLLFRRSFRQLIHISNIGQVLEALHRKYDLCRYSDDIRVALDDFPMQFGTADAPWTTVNQKSESRAISSALSPTATLDPNYCWVLWHFQAHFTLVFDAHCIRGYSEWIFSNSD